MVIEGKMEVSNQTNTDAEAQPQAMAQYAKRLTQAEMEYTTKMATEKALYDLGKVTNHMEKEMSSKLAVQKVMKEYMAQFRMEDEEVRMIYKTPVDLLEVQVERMSEQNGSLQALQESTRVGSDGSSELQRKSSGLRLRKSDKVMIYKMMIYMEMMRERIKAREKEIAVLRVSNEELDNDITNYLQEIEDLEKVIADPATFSPLKRELELKTTIIHQRNDLLMESNREIARLEEKHKRELTYAVLNAIALFVYAIMVNDWGVKETNLFFYQAVGAAVYMIFYIGAHIYYFAIRSIYFVVELAAYSIFALIG
jgi:hypothetical protein